MFDPRKIIAILNQRQVRYVLIGGFAATLHGCPEQTFDLDVLYADTPENRQNLLQALHDVGAEWDRPLTDEVLQRQPVFALNTRFGDLDIMTWIPGVGAFDQALPQSQPFQLGVETCCALNLTALIAAKEGAADPNPRKQSALLYLKDLLKRNKTPQGGQ
jgi:hypothetical protein